MRLIKNAFVTHEGLVLKNFILNFSSAFNLLGNKDHTFYLEFWKLSLEQYLVSKYGKSLSSQKLYSNTNYLLIHSKWFNYSFWMTDSLLRLYEGLSFESENSIKLIYPESWSKHPYVQETLELFPDLTFETIPDGHHIFVKRLLLPPTRKWSSEFDGKRLAPLVHYLLSKVNSDICKRVKCLGRKIYISRNKRNVRGVINEVELVHFLINQGFSIVYMEDYTIQEQIKIMQQVDFVITPHGAGCANLMFMRKNTLFIELLDEQFYHFKNPLPYKNLAKEMHVRYQSFICRTTYEEKKNRTRENDIDWRMKIVNNKIYVDIIELDVFFKMILNTPLN